MCGRYTISAPAEELAELFALAEPPAIEPRWNAAPTQRLPVVRADESGARRVSMLRWGLVPSWADDPSIGARMINARAESLAAKPAFRSALRRRRCLVPATGFFEWSGPAKARRAWLVRRRDRRAFAFAGLWETWKGAADGAPLESFTIVTTAANDIVRPVHDRMPVVLFAEGFARWLDPRTEEAALRELLAPCEPAAIECIAVGNAVNDARRDDPGCVEPIET